MIIIFMTWVFCLSIAAQPALAGDKQRYRWEGVAIGLGAAILGHALYNNYSANSYPEHVTVIDRDCDSDHSYPPPRYSGHWEVRRVWVPAMREKVWNPGHYDYGEWVPGHFIMIERTPGFWKQQEVWVARD